MRGEQTNTFSVAVIKLRDPFFSQQFQMLQPFTMSTLELTAVAHTHTHTHDTDTVSDKNLSWRSLSPALFASPLTLSVGVNLKQVKKCLTEIGSQ